MKKLIIILLFYMLMFMSTSTRANTNETIFIINGIKDELLTNAELRLTILKKSHHENENLIEKGKDEITKALQPYGYFRPTIKSFISLRDNKTTITYDIQKGIPLRLSKIIVELNGEGKKNQQLRLYIYNFPIKLGDIFNVEQYKKAKERFFDIANNQGYIRASIQKNSISIDLNSYQAKMILSFQTGGLYKFGQIHFNQHLYSEIFLYRALNITRGESFSTQKLNILQNNLSGSYYFKQVQVMPDFESISDQHEVPVNIDIIPPKSQRYSIGVGYGSMTGPRLIAGFKLHQFNENANHLEAQLKLSSVISGMGVKYYLPGKNPLTDNWITGVNYQRFLPKNGASSSITLSEGYFRKKDNVQTGMELNYLLENYKVSSKPEETKSLLYPNLTFNYSYADNLIHPRTGKSINLILRGTSIFSSTNFLQIIARGKYLFSPTDFSHVYLRASIGYTSVSDLNYLPLSMQFFAGGINSVRGYAEDSIGPGKYLRIASIEYRHHIKNNWAAALFYDAGTASNKWQSSLNKGTGVGIIYLSMIGPIRFYVAKALDRKSGQYSFEFNIGPEF